MNLSNVANLRLFNQQIAGTNRKTAKEIVSWMGAMQAQDEAMAKWAVGVRLPRSTQKTIETALDRGEILRTHVLRPTWHFVTAEDICWMLELTAPRIKASLKSRHQQLELDETVFNKCRKVITKVLANQNHLTRDELIAALTQAKIATNDSRASHLFLCAELDGLICSGAMKEKKSTYALLQERVPNTKTFSKEEALAKLAQKYFSSHGPATLQDFIWWSGLTITHAKQALEFVKADFAAEKIDEQTYWFSSASAPSGNKNSVYLLPAFDEFIISYRDRTAAITLEHHAKAVSNNGIFWPVIVVDGQVVGIWKRTIKKDTLLVETQYFHTPEENIQRVIEEKAEAFGEFLGKKSFVA